MSQTVTEYPSQSGLTEIEKEIDRRVLANVLNGIELLKREFGDDWWMKVDLDRLNLSDPRKCVLGQLYSDGPGPSYESGYVVGAQKLDIYGKDGQYGFSYHGMAMLAEELNDPWPMLTAAWKQEIQHLREVPIG